MPLPTDLKFVGRKAVRVRVPPSAPIISITANHFLTIDRRNGVNSVACPNFAQIVEEKSHLHSFELAPSDFDNRVTAPSQTFQQSKEFVCPMRSHPKAEA